MKKHIFFLLAIICGAGFASAQQREVRDVAEFTKISFGYPGKLYLKQGSPQRVEIEADDDVLKEIETEVSGGRLRISKESGWFDWSLTDEKITVWVTVPDIEAVHVSGSGDIIGQSKIKTHDLDLGFSGSGSLTLEVDAGGEVEADISGSGNMELSGTCRSFESDVSGAGRVQLSIHIQEYADLAISGSGKILASGAADVVKARISGSGKVLAADLQVNRCDVRISGSGDVEINVKNELDASISGSGSVSYRGDPKKVNSNSSGSGKVRKL